MHLDFIQVIPAWLIAASVYLAIFLLSFSSIILLAY